MKKGKIFMNCIFTILLVLTISGSTSCSSDSDFMVTVEKAPIVNDEDAFSVTLKAFAENIDITSKGEVENASLYVFDENDNYLKTINVDKSYLLEAKPIVVMDDQKHITIVACGGTTSYNLDAKGTTASNFTELLLSSCGKSQSGLPNDLFYGKAVLYPNTSATLKMERKTALLSICANGIIKKYDSRLGEYVFKIKKSKSEFEKGAIGKESQETMIYEVAAKMNDKGDLFSGSFTIFPSDSVVLELYKDNNIIFSSENSKNSRNVILKEGEQTNAIFDINANKNEILVSDWGTVIQITTIE